MDLVPIKVKIKLRNNGSAKYPNFNSMTEVANSGMDWSKYVDVNGSGWLYDCCGHQDEAPDSPMGEQWGVLLVPDAFATEAAATFPARVTRMTEVELQDFYDTKHSTKFQDEDIDSKILQDIKTKQDLGLTLTAQQQSAIDPATNEPGVRANWRKTWTAYKAKKGITILP